MTDVAEPVQSDDQGGGGADTPYAEYLNRIPEEVREQVEPVFRDWDANTTRRFQEASEYRKTWEPYEDTGINQLSRDEAQWLVQFRQALDDPASIQQWYQTYAEQNGLTQQQVEQQAQQEEFTDFDIYDPTAQQLEKILGEKLGPMQERLEAFAQWQEAQDFKVREQAAMQYIQGQIAELKEKHGDEFNEPMVEKLIAQYIETDPQNAVVRAFEDWQAILNQVSKETLQSKADAPAPAESGGVPDGNPEQITTLAQANEIAKERLRQNRMA